MKHVNTVDMEQLSDDQIAAARARRMKERCTYALHLHVTRQLHVLLLLMYVSRYRFTIAGLLAHCLGPSMLIVSHKFICTKNMYEFWFNCRDTARFDIEKMDLPENHPFAVAKQVSSHKAPFQPGCASSLLQSLCLCVKTPSS